MQSFNASPSTIIGQTAAAMNGGQAVPNQVSNSAPTFNPNNAMPAPGPMPNQSSALHAAFARRGMKPPVFPQDITGAGVNLVPNGPNQMVRQPDVTMPQVPDANPNQPGTQVTPSEAELIIKALTGRLGLIGKHESVVRDHLMPPQPQGVA